MSVPLVSIICLAYNHVPFIRQCLDGFVMQKTDFPFEVLIHDDASTDGTADIIREYAGRFPSLIVPFYEKENQFGRRDVCRETMFPYIRGRYVAFCEGDDYWTDSAKLQRQVEALEARPDAAVCFHPVTVHWEDGAFPDSVFPLPALRFHKEELEMSDLIRHNFIQTNSVMYRWRFHTDPPDLIPDGILPGDWFLHVLHAQTGKIIFLPWNMGVYRRHKDSLWYGCMETSRWFRTCAVAHYRFYEEAEKSFGADFSWEKALLAFRCCACAAASRDDAWLESLCRTFSMRKHVFQWGRMKLFLLKAAKHVIRQEKKDSIQRSIMLYKEYVRTFHSIEKELKSAKK